MRTLTSFESPSITCATSAKNDSITFIEKVLVALQPIIEKGLETLSLMFSGILEEMGKRESCTKHCTISTQIKNAFDDFDDQCDKSSTEANLVSPDKLLKCDDVWVRGALLKSDGKAREVFSLCSEVA